MLGAALGAPVGLVAPGTAPSFVTSIHNSGRYFLDQYGSPMLLLADQILPGLHNAGAVAGNLTDIETVMADRQSRGYNGFWMCLAPDSYIGANDNFSNFDGELPWLNSGDFTQPNPLYWHKVDMIIQAAYSYGMTMFLCPIDTAGAGMTQCVTDGATACTYYGTFLGNRYKTYPNIVWAHGNDFGTSTSWIAGEQTSANWALIKDIITAIRGTGDTHLHSCELNYLVAGNAGGSLSTDDTVSGGVRATVDFNWGYTYNQTYDVILNGYLGLLSNAGGSGTRAYTMPVVLGEANYEGGDNIGNGANPATALCLRNQGYWTMLSGGCGQVWGNKVLHHFTTVAPTITAATNATTTITATLSAVTNLYAGQVVVVSGAAGGTWSNINGTWKIASVNSGTSQITFVVTTAPTGSYTASSATANASWQNNLATTGAQDAARLAAFFRSYSWWLLLPDTGHTFVTVGYGTYNSGATLSTPTGGTYCTAAVAADGSVGMCYCPQASTITVAMSKMRGSTIARWWDPTNNTYTTITGSPFTNSGTQTFKSGSASGAATVNNSAGDPDWVLVLTA